MKQRPSTSSGARNRAPRSAAPASASNRGATGGTPPAGAWRLSLLFTLPGLLRIGAAFLPESRLWGLNHLAFLSLPAAVTLAAAGILLPLPLTHRAFSAIAARVFKDRRPGAAFVLVCAALAGVVFWMLRLYTPFLGDGAVYAAEVFRYVRGLDFAPDVLFSNGSAPLTGRLIAWTGALAWSVGGGANGVFETPLAPFWLTGALLGVVWVAAALRIASARGGDPVTRLGLALLLLFSPGVLFFFGYVEYYTLHFVLVLLYLAALDAAATGERPLWPAVVLFLGAVASHLMAAVLLPSLLVVVLRRAGDARLQRWVTLRTVGGAFALAVAAGLGWYVLSGAWEHGSRVVLSLVPFGPEGAVQRYTLLSSWHLADIANEVLLLGAPALAALLLLLRRGGEKGGAPAGFWNETAPLAMLAALTGMSLLLAGGYTCFGMARDWDVNAAWGIALLFVLITVLRRARDARLGSYLAFAAGTAALAGGIAWFAVQVSQPAAVARFRAIMALDDRHVTGDFALNGYEHLNKWYRSAGDAAGSAWAIGKKVEMVGYPADYRKYYVALTALSPTERTAGYDSMYASITRHLRAMRAQGRDRAYAGTRQEFLELYVELVVLQSSEGLPEPQVRARLDAIEAAVGADPLIEAGRQLDAWRRSGVASDLAGAGPVPGVEQLRAAAGAIGHSSLLAIWAGGALLSANDAVTAADVLARALRRNPGYHLLCLYLGMAELRLPQPRPADARAHVQRFLDHPDALTAVPPAQRASLLQLARGLIDQADAMERSGVSAAPDQNLPRR